MAKTVTDVKEIWSKTALKALALKLGVREDWHEPDEQDVSVKIEGKTFDNAGTASLPVDFSDKSKGEKPYEMYAVVYVGERPVAKVNVAMLFAMASGHEGV